MFEDDAKIQAHIIETQAERIAGMESTIRALEDTSLRRGEELAAARAEITVLTRRAALLEAVADRARHLVEDDHDGNGHCYTNGPECCRVWKMAMEHCRKLENDRDALCDALYELDKAAEPQEVPRG